MALTLTTLGVLALLLFGLWAYGRALPAVHHATVSYTVHHPPEVVYAALLDVEAYPQWRSDVDEVQVLARSAGIVTAWVELADGDRHHFAVLDTTPPYAHTVDLGGSTQFGGSWTFGLTPTPQGTSVTATEDGWVEPPLLRALLRLFGEDATLRRHAQDLQQRLPPS